MLSLPDSSLLRAYRRRSLSQRVHWPTMCDPGGKPGALGPPQRPVRPAMDRPDRARVGKACLRPRRSGSGRAAGPDRVAVHPKLTRPEIADRVGCTEPTVVLWRHRFAIEGLAGLDDRPRKPPPRTVVTEQVRDEILTVTLTRPPEELGITYWSSRLLADWLRRSGTAVSHDSISRFVAPVRDPALAVRDVQVLHRPRARSQGPRRRRPVPQPAPRRCSRCAPTSLSGRPMTITGTAPPPCSPRSR
jgi:transposase